jgi:hypothetical protein
MHKSKHFDKRIVNRNIKKKLISQKDLDSFKKELEDDNNRLEVIKVDVDDIDDDMPKADDYKD